MVFKWVIAIEKAIVELDVGSPGDQQFPEIGAERRLLDLLLVRLYGLRSFASSLFGQSSSTSCFDRRAVERQRSAGF